MSNQTASLIASNSTRTPNKSSKSIWQGRNSGERLRLVFSFYSPDGNEISIPIASMSAYIKRELDFVDVILAPILIGRFPEQFTPAKFAKNVVDLKPDLIAFSLMSPHWHPTEPYLESLKQELPCCPIVIGGYQAMLSQEQTISNPNVDFICVGDGEHAIGNLIQHIQGLKGGTVDGMWEKLSDGSINQSEPHQLSDLNALPFPDYDLFAKEDGFAQVISSIFGPKGKIVLPVMTGRGCPYRCTYCCNTPLLDDWKDKKTFLRKYDPESLVNELQRLQAKYNVGYFEFWDELFLSNLKFVKAFFVLYKKKIHLPFSINSRVEVMHKGFCEMAADAGCHTIWFGIESGDEQYRTKMLGRKMSNEKVIEAAENCKKAGIFRLTFNIVGMPFESAENMRETLRLNEIIAPEFFFFFPYIPLRGTPLYDTAKKAGLLLPLRANIHYLSSVNDSEFVLNLKEQPELLTQQQYSDICLRMMKFQQSNNRLSYVTGNQGGRLEEIPTNEESHLLSQSLILKNKSNPVSLRDTQQPYLLESKDRKSLTSRRLTMEPLSEKHAQYLHESFKDEQFWKAYRMNQDRNLDLEGVKRQLHEEGKYSNEQIGKFEWVIFKITEEGRKPIGLAGLTDYIASQKRAEFLVGIPNPDDRRSGIGLEASLMVFDFAFNAIYLNKLLSLIYGGNEESQRNTLSLGFKSEGVLRQHFRSGLSGQFIDVYQNGLLCSEFRNSQRLAKLSRRLLGADITQKAISVEKQYPGLHASFQIR